jgi:predicted hotdog family 3-hydroxylacyl-ACP dehydratase
MQDVTQFSIEELVPHAHPMILIDEAVEANEEHLVAKVTVRENNLFFDKELNAIPSWVGMEMMAQTIAAYAGYQERISNRPVRIGFLLGTRKYQSHHVAFTLGKEYMITVTKLFQEENGLGAFSCVMQCDDQEVARANINVFSSQNVEEFLAQHAIRGRQ